MHTHTDKVQQKKSQSVATIIDQSANDHRHHFPFADNSPRALTQRKLLETTEGSSKIGQLKAIQEMADNSLRLKQASAQAIPPEVAQRFLTDDEMDLSSGDVSSEYEEPENEAPDGYMTPSDYHDEYGGSDHSDLDGEVWAGKVDGRVALWWINPNEESWHKLQGTRPKDVAALGGDDDGYTWHHCADYAGGYCTMQQVPTDEHSSWGHAGGARQAAAAGMLGYLGAAD